MPATSSIRFAFRSLKKNFGTSLLAVLALGLGIGLTTAMFSLVFGVLLTPPSFTEPDRLMSLGSFSVEQGPSRADIAFEVPAHDFAEWRDQMTTFAGIGALDLASVNLNDEGGYPERYSAGVLSWNVPALVGVPPVIGRSFTVEDDRPGASPVALLGYDLWRSRFAMDEAIVGATVRLNGETTTIVGVMPKGFALPINQDLFIPHRLDLDAIPRGEHGLAVIGRLADGATPEGAQAELETLAARQATTWPESNGGRGVLVEGYRASLNNEANSTILGVMFVAVFLVLIVACANVASLILVRSATRIQEMALRSALGAHRSSLMGILVLESLLLSLFGAVLGLGFAKLGTLAIDRAFSWQTLPFWMTFEIQPAAYAFVSGAGVLAGVAAGLLPALKATGAATFDLLKDQSRGSTGFKVGRLSRVLVVTEIAMACALLVVTGLMVRSVANYSAEDLPFDTASILVADLHLSEAGYPADRDTVAFYERLVEDLSSRPDVVTATIMSRPPGDYMGRSHYSIEGSVYENQSDYPASARGIVSPAFFDTFGIELVEGRLFTTFDTAESPQVVIVNRSFATQTWPGETALGKRLRLGRGDDGEGWRTVVGMVPDAGVSLLNPAFAGTTTAGFYVPHAQMPFRQMSLGVKTEGDPSAFTTTLRQRVGHLDATLPVDRPRTMQRVVWENTFGTQVIAVCFSVFGGVALLLAAVGIFGLMMFSVTQRTPEIGIRMAMGASPGQVLRMTLRQGAGRLLIGLALGLVLAVGLGSAMRMALYGVAPTDPATFLVTVLVLGTAALLACLVPAWRASRVDPMVALHDR